ncbi:Exoenzymes regulatory protein AepA precursor, partial [hydrothermal vent metagenome]
MKTNIITTCILVIISLSSVAKVSIIHNIKGNTINQNQHITFSAMAFADKKILAIGLKSKLLNTYPNAILIDGEGKAMLPGLHDAHGHVLYLANSKNEINLMGAASIEESLQIIQKFIDEHPQNHWILGHGWNQTLWQNKKFPTYADLDKLKTDKPIWLTRVDGHAGWANSKAMEIASSNKHLKDMPGGEIIIDKHGMQTGIFIDNAMAIIANNIVTEKLANTNELIYKTLSYLASMGITSVDDAGIDWSSYSAYKALAQNQQLPIRVNAMLASNSPALPKMLALGLYKGEFLQIQTIKYMLDGALGSRGAAMLKPYDDQPNSTGKLVQSRKFLQKLIYNNAETGWQAAIHAIGDLANKIAIEVLADKKAKTRILRNRIEHAQIVDFADLKKFHQHHIIASIQPTHATSDMNMAQDRVGRNRLRGAYAWQTLIKKGTILASGSDFPVEPANPFYGIHAAVTRQDRN